jgi:hypothetical protein
VIGKVLPPQLPQRSPIASPRGSKRSGGNEENSGPTDLPASYGANVLKQFEKQLISANNVGM